MERSDSSKKRRDQADIIRSIYEALPAKDFDTVNNIAEKAGVDRETTLRNLEIMDLVLSLQSGRYLEIVKVGDRVTAYRRKPRRGEKAAS
ncbi:MAG: hypothetical protein KAX31_00270 [Thermoplasmata archaeon]|nr:hypothetical protein [Thermoplasmata archaeon]